MKRLAQKNENKDKNMITQKWGKQILKLKLDLRIRNLEQKIWKTNDLKLILQKLKWKMLTKHKTKWTDYNVDWFV